MEEQDFIVSELLSELKRENERKDKQIKSLHKVIIWSIVSILIVIGACFFYLYQYDFTSSDTLSIEKSAEGVYAMIDSDGNIVGYDLPIDDDGESNISSNENNQS